MAVNREATLGDLVIEDSRRAPVLEGFRIDYCCHGDRTLGDAIVQAGLDEAMVMGALDLPAADDVPSVEAPRENAALAHDIVDTHHAYMWAEMPRLQGLVEKVWRVHGGGHAELAEVNRAYGEAVAALDPHMTTEERVVFPAISRMEKSGTGVTGVDLADSIVALREEHSVVGEIFAQIRSLTNDYAVPDDACNSYRLMLEGLERMELDLHEHIHKENNVLFPRAIELQQRLANPAD